MQQREGSGARLRAPPCGGPAHGGLSHGGLAEGGPGSWETDMWGPWLLGEGCLMGGLADGGTHECDARDVVEEALSPKSALLAPSEERASLPPWASP